LIIGDGMDDQQITIARNYLVGSAGRLTLDGLPFRAAVQVLTVDENDPTLPVYVADSANTATSIATGAVTSAGRIATTPGSDEDLVTIMELAHAAELGTGIVTTASLTDATPASFAAHINERFCQGPTDMVGTLGLLNMRIDCSRDYKSNGGRGSIAEQLAASDIDVLLGGGAQYFEQLAEGAPETTVTDMAVANGYGILRGREELDNMPDSGKWLGLFSRDTMPVRLRGQHGAEAVPVGSVDGRVRLPEPFGCEPNPDFEGLPTLAEMTRGALRFLDSRGGFILMVESASIDKQSHLRRPCGSIGELAQLDEALGVALEYTAAHPETLILVTADHSHAAQIVSDTGQFLALNVASPGHFARVLTPEGAIMGINYATNNSSIQEYHTGAQIPLYAAGPGTETLPAFMHQTELFSIMARHLRLRSEAAP
jgi:alkaline phosphatase